MAIFESKKTKYILLAVTVAVGLVVLYGFGQAQDFQRKNQRLLQQARDLTSEGKYDQAIEIYQELRQRIFALDEKYAVTLAIATAYKNKEDYNQAITWYKEAEKLKGKPDPATAAGIAGAAEALGDKETAINQYKLAVRLLKAEVATGEGAPLDGSLIKYYEEKITGLGGTL